MPIFQYNGRDQKGNFVSGEHLSESAGSLSEQLFSEGITPVHIRLKEERVNVLNKLKMYFEKKQITNSELSMFTRQMYTLNKAGIIASSALKYLSKTSRNLYFSQILLSISQMLESGQSLSSAMERYPNLFSPLMIAMVRIGQSTGKLDNAFLRLTEYLELEESTIKRVKTAIRYPIFVISAIIIGIIIINIFVIPAFSKVYMRSNLPLPWVTSVLIGVSNFFVANWIYLLSLIVIVGIALRQYLKSPEGKYRWHKYQLKMPIVGSLLHRIILLRFSETFALVVNAAIPINEGLTLVAESVNNQYAREEIITMRNAIQRGSGIFQAATSCKLFTGLELQMLAISEETGRLGEMLSEIGYYYRREVDYDLKHLIDIVEPLLLLGIAAMVLFLALAVYMPIWNMVKLVHRG